VVPKVDGTMDANTLKITLRAGLSETRGRLDRVAGIAKAAEACAEANNIEKAVEIILDVEQLTYEVNTLLNFASMMHWIWKPELTLRRRPCRDRHHGHRPWPDCSALWQRRQPGEGVGTLHPWVARVSGSAQSQRASVRFTERSRPL